MTQAKDILKACMIGASFLGVAACQHTNVSAPTPHENAIRNSVEMVRLPYTIVAESDATDDLSAKTKADITRFLTSVQAGYGDVLILDGPEASDHRLTAVADYLRKRGLSYAGNAPVGRAPGQGNITLYVERYQVVTPKCGIWTREVNNQQRNNDSAYFGCANTSNLGLMVANPRDLIAGHSTGNSTAAAVGALYTPQPAQGPSVTLSFEGIPTLTEGSSTTQPAGNSQ